MKELKDRIYFFIPTRQSIGSLVAYRDDLGDTSLRCDLEEIFDLKRSDKDALVRALYVPEPFVKIFECERNGKRVAVEFVRMFSDVQAMYCAIELKAKYSDTLAAYDMSETFGIFSVSDCVEYGDAVKSDQDPHLTVYLAGICNAVLSQRDQSALINDPETVANAIAEICDFVGTQLELDLVAELMQYEDVRFSFRRCMELVAVFACVARRHTKRRLLSVELCKCADNFRVRLSLDINSDSDEASVTSAVAHFCEMTDSVISVVRDQSYHFEAIPSELELDVVGVKQDIE